ncbi:hypothetical protein OG799_13370 [Micromonospora sp. NBC_00898]|uniref:hypothetical protein n=1 Tax=Micromonospora sp. NBC_00898 TaxID=2975981 RepID=UPI003868C6FA|nr:hypothetical protein OG799_13370 [Micromonospora sp. NBC_00898]
MGERKVVVYGPSRVPWLRPLARPPVPRRTYLGAAAGGSVAGAFLFGGHPHTALVLFGATALATTPVLAALGTRRHVTLTGTYGRRTWTPIGAAYASLLRSLPELHPMIELRPTRLALERARLDLADLVARRQRAHAARDLVRRAGHGLAPDDPVCDDLSRRDRLLEATLGGLDAEPRGADGVADHAGRPVGRVRLPPGGRAPRRAGQPPGPRHPRHRRRRAGRRPPGHRR